MVKMKDIKQIVALNIKVFKKNCDTNKNCKIINSEGALNSELKLAILKKAAV